MTFEERVEFLMEVYGMSREDAEWQVGAKETPGQCLVDVAKTSGEAAPK
jgi:hypothetical protein